MTKRKLHSLAHSLDSRRLWGTLTKLSSCWAPAWDLGHPWRNYLSFVSLDCSVFRTSSALLLRLKAISQLTVVWGQKLTIPNMTVLLKRPSDLTFHFPGNVWRLEYRRKRNNYKTLLSSSSFSFFVFRKSSFLQGIFHALILST